jgi:hypothetical protein
MRLSDTDTATPLLYCFTNPDTLAGSSTLYSSMFVVDAVKVEQTKQ